ncbi:flagellar biosynthesis regulatory protein FlaF [Glycocaulis alkaliphilus]|uniref:Flagellar biosynthesis regulatory protein FlaF n=1 Tax=Glycocaulis alkaliphilus TaxID=1434191 RepID=A0A3T0EBA6_9PROT|nr:flagellar biosynthesis regulator FlaF [Glycocaulis alkaliphilus]AZU04723.1 flagellar biosynthesis regulatory protein FlaF [Glycocaulis alkaliphilus]GGB68184.1 flagellar biosynthesis regulatory protein FlaF [Glycocaulis alkaliphilus]
MSYQAYQTAAARTEDPRSAEYRLFGQVTRALLAARECGASELSKRADALDWNRRMWTAFAADCSSEDNKLPESLRAAIISLSIFVSRQTSDAIRDNDAVDTLIEINRTIMQGLAPQGQGAASAA